MGTCVCPRHYVDVYKDAEFLVFSIRYPQSIMSFVRNKLTATEYEAGKALRESIANSFWTRLTRQLTAEKVIEVTSDTKFGADQQPALFIPKPELAVQGAYYSQAKNLMIKQLPLVSEYNDDVYYYLGQQAGVLGMAFEQGQPMKYIVPGGRFNEFYGWDSYFIALGLIEDGKYELAGNIAKQYVFEVRNFGKILNASRPYYLGRSQPPFLTDLAWRLKDHCDSRLFIDWIKGAILEYKTVWTAAPRLDPTTGLSKYVAQGRGFPPEVEEGHYDKLVKPYAEKYCLDIKTFMREYNAKSICEPELDIYLLHDRSLRESGHDVASRFVNCCADLVTIDLASLLYKFELDIARAIEAFPQEFSDENSEHWLLRAERRKEAVNKYLWDPERGTFGDYNVVQKRLNTEAGVLSGSVFWALWSGLASREQAKSLVENALPYLEFDGGIASSSKVPDNGCQWDYPAGWAPHQILAWEGLRNYSYPKVAERLALKWVKTIIQGASLTSGAVFEKYDVTGVDEPHEVRAEYGNQGSNQTGFGWTNASFAIAWDRYISDMSL